VNAPHGKSGDLVLVNNPAKWFTKSGIFSALIRQKTGSDWSHVGTLLSWGDASLLRVGLPEIKRRYVTLGNAGEFHVAEAMPSGYIVRPASVYAGVPWRVRTWTEPLTTAEWKTGLACLEGFVGIPYDWTGLLGFVNRRSSIGDNAKLFCSEAAMLVAQTCGRLVGSELPSRLAPPSWYAQLPSPPVKTTAWQGIRPEGWID